jgi:hypothetical protein
MAIAVLWRCMEFVHCGNSPDRWAFVRCFDVVMFHSIDLIVLVWLLAVWRDHRYLVLAWVGS